ncbi:MAG: BrnA antitoxin family protein [Rhodanobacteraceae bacterium]
MPKKSASSRSATRHAAKPASISKKSRTDLRRLFSGEPGTPTPDSPEVDRRYIIRGIVRRGLAPGLPKTSIALRVDSDVLAWFKAQGAGYQTRMNAVLRAFRDASI